MSIRHFHKGNSELINRQAQIIYDHMADARGGSDLCARDGEGHRLQLISGHVEVSQLHVVGISSENSDMVISLSRDGLWRIRTSKDSAPCG